MVKIGKHARAKPTPRQKEDFEEFMKRLDDEAKANGLPDAVHLIAQRDPAMAEIFARMIKAEIAHKRSGCTSCPDD